MKKEHWIIVGVGAVGIYLYMNNKKKKDEEAAAALLAATKETKRSASGDISPCLGANTPDKAPHTCQSVCEANGGSWSADVGGQFGGCIGGSVGQFGYGYGSKKLMRR